MGHNSKTADVVTGGLVFGSMFFCSATFCQDPPGEPIAKETPVDTPSEDTRVPSRRCQTSDSKHLPGDEESRKRGVIERCGRAS